ncbi:MAG: PIG-L family deacetylase [Acidobacteria bacterium]|nr:PIG-L family deacetylase [Acidobacteriota bacterium]MBI3423766.1 PIG-L family deacetylase [Acidobacteriota bacterium]
MYKRFGIWLSLFLVAALTWAAVSSADTRPAPEDRGATGLALLLRRLQTIASVLHTAAHPDDESTEMMAYCARKEGARTAYLSLNRGDGGQNGIGPELWDMLGVLRTEELLASRKIDGAEQYFTRAFDFGFTRSPEETLQKWNREEILGDMVRVIRRMRPLVVVNGWSGTAQDGHGQHQVAGLLTPEAIKAAADPARFPEQVKQGLQPWPVLKFYARRFGGGQQGPQAQFDVGAYDPVIGRSYMEIAADGRSRHRSQDFGQVQPRGSFVRSFPRLASPLGINIETPAVEASLFDGLDVTLTGVARFAGKDGERLLPALTKIKAHAAQALGEFRLEHPDLIAPHLAAGLREVRALRASLHGLDPVAQANVEEMLARKEHEFNDALARAHGVVVDALSNTEIAAPGEAVEISANVYLGATGKAAKTTAQFKLLAPTTWQIASAGPEVEAPSSVPAFFRNRETADASARFRATVPANETPSQPYWLVQPRTKDQYDWPAIGADFPFTQPFAPPLLRAQVTLELSGERVVLTQPVEYRYSDKTFGEFRHELKVAPALTLNVSPALLIVPSGAPNRTREITVEITHNARRATNGTLKLEAPAGWKVESAAAPLAFTKQGEKTSRTFKVTPPPGANGNVELKAVATADGVAYANGYTKIEYTHIEPRYVYKPATAKLELFDVNVAANLNVGYVMGSGDDGPEVLRQLGVNVHLIGPAELAASDLSGYDTIVLGIRVYEVNDAVMANNKRLLDYVSNGGTLIVQYNKNEIVQGNFLPYPAKMGNGARVTDETAPITVQQPEHPLFNAPNKITAADWQGWVQERGLYFMTEFDAHYTSLLAAPDDTGKVLNGGELIAQYGKGTYIFTGYAWFRQFPAGVPGAYRLFANLVSLPKASALKK